jgi:hypothetical protein
VAISRVAFETRRPVETPPGVASVRLVVARDGPGRPFGALVLGFVVAVVAGRPNVHRPLRAVRQTLAALDSDLREPEARADLVALPRKDGAVAAIPRLQVVGHLALPHVHGFVQHDVAGEEQTAPEHPCTSVR